MGKLEVFAGSALFGVALSSLVAWNAQADIRTDGTIGPRLALTGPNYGVTADLGRQVGGNLFHSFSQFNLQSAESATFSGPTSVQNIIARVTGGSPSSLDGGLRSTISGANLWLVNPSGVTFGANASIDVSGSLFVGTGSYLRLADGVRFDAVNPGNASTLTTAPPAAFGFAGPAPEALQIAGGGAATQRFRVGTGKTLSLVGGNITVTNITLSAPGGRIELASLASAGEIAFSNSGTAILESAKHGTVTLSNAVLEAHGSAGRPAGPIGIRGGRLVMLNSQVNAYNLASAPGGELTIDASQELRMSGGSIVTVANGSGPGGDINVRSPAVALEDAAAVLALSCWIAGQSCSAPRAGAVTVSAPLLTLSGGAVVGTAGLSNGAAGSVQVVADDLRLDYGFIANDTGGAGNAGATTVRAGALSLVNDGSITSITQGAGAGGDIDIQARTVDISGGRAFPEGRADPVTGLTYYGFYSGIYSTAQGARSGPGGSLRLAADALRIADGGTISGVTVGSGSAGTVTIDARNVSLEGGGLIHTSTSGTGSAGSITINAAESVSATGALDQARFAGFAPRGSPVSGIVSKATVELNPLSPVLGNGGTIAIATPFLKLAGGAEISASAEKNALGGRIEITAGRVELASGASIASASLGTGNAGEISVRADESLSLVGGAALTTEARGADGGNISLQVGNLLYLQGSKITTAVGTGFGNGGNITIDPQFLVLNQSSIIANAFGGNGGNISITAGQFLRSPDSVVSASSQLGVAGTIVISSPPVDVSGSLAELPVSYLDAAALLTNPCAARLAGKASSLVLLSQPLPPLADPDTPSIASAAGFDARPLSRCSRVRN
ncbi:MAG: filamentous hemagglutinin N-terminal domain-containing protein [Betaproteobacteria bacterium]|nr:filamentous hemagglutinin N-terminal domain-containing protein [Betaproteobacteria bacterium]